MKLKRSKYDILINTACLILLVGIIVFLGVNWHTIPDKIPGHYNASGIINRWGNKGELWIVPVIAWIMYLGITALEHFPQIWNTGVEVTKENKERVYWILKNLIGTVKLIMSAVFVFLTVNSAFAVRLPVWFLPVFLILIFGSVIIFIVKLAKAK